MASDPYVRVYSRIIDDPRFSGIYTDDHHLATWLRLLIQADAVWPSSVPVPRTCRKPSMTALVRVGLVEILPGDLYRIHGLDAERQKRSDWGKNAADRRWQSGRIAGAMPSQSESNAHPMLASPRPRLAASAPSARVRERVREDVPVEDQDGYDQVVTWLASRKAWIDSPKIATDLARMVDRDGVEAVMAALAVQESEGMTEAAQYVYGARNHLHPLPGTKTQPKKTRAEMESEEARRQLGINR